MNSEVVFAVAPPSCLPTCPPHCLCDVDSPLSCLASKGESLPLVHSFPQFVGEHGNTIYQHNKISRCYKPHVSAGSVRLLVEWASTCLTLIGTRRSSTATTRTKVVFWRTLDWKRWTQADSAKCLVKGFNITKQNVRDCEGCFNNMRRGSSLVAVDRVMPA